jgi:hypothetical protein
MQKELTVQYCLESSRYLYTLLKQRPDCEEVYCSTKVVEKKMALLETLSELQLMICPQSTTRPLHIQCHDSKLCLTPQTFFQTDNISE